MKKILVADDDASTRKLLVSLIEKMGYAVIQAEDGKQCFDILKVNTDVQLLITDMMMPKLNGEDLINQIHTDDKLKNIPIIMISGLVKLSDISHILNAGASYFVPKPVASDILKDYIKKLID